MPIPAIAPERRKEEHHKLAAALRPKRDAKRAETAKKRAAKRPKVEAETDTKVLGKRKADFEDDLNGDSVKGDGG